MVRHARHAEVKRLNQELLGDPNSFKISSAFAGAAAHSEFEYIHSRADSTLVIRQCNGELELDYLFFKVAYIQQDWKIIDLYMLIYDTYLSSLIRNTAYFPIVFEALERENSANILANSKIYKEARNLYSAGEVNLAYSKLSGIPLEERLRDYQVYKIFLATKIEEDEKLVRSVQEYQARFEQLEGLSLLLLDYYVVVEAYDSARQVIVQMDSMVGGDAHLHFYEGLLYMFEDNWQKSAERMEQADFENIEEEYFLSFLFIVLNEQKAHRQAIEVLDKLAATEYYTAADLVAWIRRELPTIARSGAFKRWAKRQSR